MTKTLPGGPAAEAGERGLASDGRTWRGGPVAEADDCGLASDGRTWRGGPTADIVAPGVPGAESLRRPSAAMACGAVLIDELARLGVGHVVLSPGSRSAPLAYAAHAADAAGRLTLWVRHDERTAGFFALGLAKASDRAVALVTTSGTAVANLAPALLESRHAHVPLIALTADRPATLVGTGANQTTDQVALLRGVALAVVRVASVERSPRAWRQAVRRALVTAEGRLTRTPGPVQVNVELTPPLVGDPGPLAPGPLFHCQEPIPPLHRSEPQAAAAAADPLGRAALAATPRTVVVVGDLSPAQGRRWAGEAELAGLPLLAEPSSNARRGTTAIRFYRDLLPQFEAEIDRVIVLGHPTLSRPVTALLSRPDLGVTVVAETADWPDPGWAVSSVVSDLALPAGDPDWLARWQRADRQRGDLDAADPMGRRRPGAAGSQSATTGESARPTGPDPTAPSTDRTGPVLTGPALAAAVLAALGPGDNLVLGASNPLRDADLAPIHPDPPDVYANRGLAGIDGTIATAFGVAAGGRPTTALIGDLTALHDLGSLIIPTLERRLDLRVVVADDDGGSIFSGLEYGTFEPAGQPRGPDAGPSALARCFTLPTGVDLVAVAAALGARATRLTTPADVAAALAEPWSGCRFLVVPVRPRRPGVG